jgi:hypothetical protein
MSLSSVRRFAGLQARKESVSTWRCAVGRERMRDGGAHFGVCRQRRDRRRFSVRRGPGLALLPKPFYSRHQVRRDAVRGRQLQRVSRSPQAAGCALRARLRAAFERFRLLQGLRCRCRCRIAICLRALAQLHSLRARSVSVTVSSVQDAHRACAQQHCPLAPSSPPSPARHFVTNNFRKFPRLPENGDQALERRAAPGTSAQNALSVPLKTATVLVTLQRQEMRKCAPMCGRKCLGRAGPLGEIRKVPARPHSAVGLPLGHTVTAHLGTVQLAGTRRKAH